MPIFGFAGRLPGAHPPDTLREYGAAVMGAAPNATAAGEWPHAGWAPQVAHEGGVTVLLEGQPWWRNAPPNGEASPAAQILQAFKRDGEGLLERLRGRFSLAIIDGPARRVLLAVDPMGIERMTFAERDGWIVFATSAESVARFPPRSPTVRPQALFDYLLLHIVPGPETVFEGVWKLRPASVLLFEHGRTRLARYWLPRFAATVPNGSDGLKQELFTSLRTAVKAAAPDERTGAFLSGGLDSSTVAGVLAENGPAPAKTFSIGFGYPEFDELPYARIASGHFRCKAHEYVVKGADIVETFPHIARAYDEPFGNSSALPVFYCARLARENGVDHLLAGDGGDELFAGNSRYADQQVFERYQSIPRIVRRALLEPAIGRWPHSLSFWLVRKARGYVQKANVPLPERLESYNIIYQVGPQEFFHPDFLQAIDPHAPLSRMREVWESTPSGQTLDRMLYYDWHYTLADNDLRKVETMSRLAGVRVSYPMLHSDVVEMSNHVPANVKMPGRQLRDFYKRAMQGYLPDAIIHKKKHGFGLPFGHWLNDSPQLREIIFGNLSQLRSRNIVRPQFIDQLLNLHRNEDASHYGVFLWVLAMLEQWFQEHRLDPRI